MITEFYRNKNGGKKPSFSKASYSTKDSDVASTTTGQVKPLLTKRPRIDPLSTIERQFYNTFINKNPTFYTTTTNQPPDPIEHDTTNQPLDPIKHDTANQPLDPIKHDTTNQPFDPIKHDTTDRKPSSVEEDNVDLPVLNRVHERPLLTLMLNFYKSNPPSNQVEVDELYEYLKTQMRPSFTIPPKSRAALNQISDTLFKTYMELSDKNENPNYRQLVTEMGRGAVTQIQAAVDLVQERQFACQLLQRADKEKTRLWRMKRAKSNQHHILEANVCSNKAKLKEQQDDKQAFLSLESFFNELKSVIHEESITP